MQTYRQYSDTIYDEVTQKVLKHLPQFVFTFISAHQGTWASRTKTAYVQDISDFFEYLTDYHYVDAPSSVTVELMDRLGADDIEPFKTWLNQAGRHNSAVAMKRKLSALASLYRYLQTHGKVGSNPMPGVVVAKDTHKNDSVVALNTSEREAFLNAVEKGTEKTTKHMNKFRERTVLRDKAIVYLLLGTGLRVSELVGINLTDLSFEDNSVWVTRKENERRIVYFSNDVATALQEYVEEEREKYAPYLPFKKKGETEEEFAAREITYESDQPALFYSNKRHRMSVRAVQKMVKKYADMSITSGKHITAHKMRSTYATSLYQETNDIYLVATALNHKNIETTKRYAERDSLRLEEIQKNNTIHKE